MISKEKLDKITETLIVEVFRNEDIMLDARFLLEHELIINNEYVDLIDIIASLHNLLYEAVTGSKYNYMWHWANKVGAWCEDNIFEEGDEIEEI